MRVFPIEECNDSRRNHEPDSEGLNKNGLAFLHTPRSEAILAWGSILREVAFARWQRDGSRISLSPI